MKGCGCYLHINPSGQAFPSLPAPFPNLSGLICANSSGRCCGAGLCLAEFVPDGGPRCSKMQTKSIVTTPQIYIQDNGHHLCWGYCSQGTEVTEELGLGWAELMWAQQREDFPRQEHKYSSLVPWNKLLGILFFIFILLLCFSLGNTNTIVWISTWTPERIKVDQIHDIGSEIQYHKIL